MSASTMEGTADEMPILATSQGKQLRGSRVKGWSPEQVALGR